MCSFFDLPFFPPSGLKKRKKRVDKTDLAEKAILNAPREYSRLLPFWTSNSKVNFNASRTVQAEGAVEDKVYKKKPERRKLISSQSFGANRITFRECCGRKLAKPPSDPGDVPAAAGSEAVF